MARLGIALLVILAVRLDVALKLMMVPNLLHRGDAALLNCLPFGLRPAGPRGHDRSRRDRRLADAFLAVRALAINHDFRSLRRLSEDQDG